MNKAVYTTFIPNEDQMLALGVRFARACSQTAVIFLYGDLGAGKTTLARGFLRGVGYEGKVKSPTYTLVEPYTLPERVIFHFDFYRLQDAVELEFIGIQDYFLTNAICLIEWPERGSGELPAADLSCYLIPHLQGRQVRFEAHSTAGAAVINQLQQDVI